MVHITEAEYERLRLADKVCQRLRSIEACWNAGSSEGPGPHPNPNTLNRDSNYKAWEHMFSAVAANLSK